MKSPASIGMNRTGIDHAPVEYQALLEGLDEFALKTTGNKETPVAYREVYIREADPIGTVPAPATMKGVAKAGMQKLMGRNAEAFIDKLGGRLAFERTGTRLYDAFLSKCTLRMDEATKIPIDQLQHFREEEAAHMEMVWEAMRQLGADPTAVTPMADINGVASVG